MMDAVQWNACHLPLRDGIVDVFVSDLVRLFNYVFVSVCVCALFVSQACMCVCVCVCSVSRFVCGILPGNQLDR